MKFLPTVPSHVRDVVNGRLRASDLSSEEIALGEKLVTDERMREQWRKLAENYNATGGFCLQSEIWGDYYFWAAVQRFGLACNADPWERMTFKEQSRWFARMDTLFAEVEEHLKSAPAPPTQLASIVSYEDMIELVGIAESEKINLFRRLWNVEWGLVDAMREVARTQKSMRGNEDAVLKRPRHEKSSRERYIALLTRDLHCFYDQSMQELVAVTTEIAFDDPGVTVRLVRRVTSGK